MNSPSSPAWSISGRNNLKLESVNPGPGAYDPKSSTQEFQPTFKIGTSTRDEVTLSSITVPGPGTYDPSISKINSAPKFGTSERVNEKSSSIPGPGTYEIPNKVQEGPQYSMKGKYKNSPKNDLPGPGTYTNDYKEAVFEKPPAFKIGKANRGSSAMEKEKTTIPGPGTYAESRSEAGPSWGFGSDNRVKIIADHSPGPGAYEMPVTLNKISYSISGRPKTSDNKHNLPAPGSYDPKLMTSMPAYSIGNSIRYDHLRNNLGPAPGTYEPNIMNSSPKAPVFGTDKRRPLSANIIVPGPGTYDIPSKLREGPQFSMTSKNFKSVRNSTPGPGQYRHTLHEVYTEKAPAFSYGKSNRKSIVKEDSVPGPGSYNSVLKDPGKKCVFGSDSRSKEIKHTNPGPGTYSLSTSLDRRAYSMLGKHKVRNNSETPGPGAYNPQLILSVPSYRLGTSTRNSSNGFKMGSPGPGAYDPRQKLRSNGAVFGSTKKSAMSFKMSTPGPGTYDIPSKVKEGPLYSMRPKTSKLLNNSSPGPGQYNPDGSVFSKSPGWKLGSSKRKSSLRDEIPGPGMYDTRDDIISPKWGFAKESRDKQKLHDSPGPGAYEIKSTIPNPPPHVNMS